MHTLQFKSSLRDEARLIPAEWLWHYQTLQSLRDRLLTESGDQLAQAAEPMEAHSLHPADSASDEYDHDLAMHLLSMEQSALGEVDAAIERIRHGTYGICEETRLPIPEERLRAVPWTRFNRPVQERHDHEDRPAGKWSASGRRIPVTPPEMTAAVRCFKDRRDAGRLLGAALRQYAHRSDVIVIGLPRGGVPVACEVARALRAPLDVIVVRKLGVPGHEELAMGAISSGGVRVLNDDVVQCARIAHAEIEAATARESTELHRREIAWRGRTGPPDVTGKTVLLIDDGIATGSTVQAAAKALRAQDLTSIVIGVPVISAEACEILSQEVDDLVALMIPDNFKAVGQWYGDFNQISDSCVGKLLAEAGCRAPDSGPHGH